jgi:hypothetical protein
MAVLAKKDSKQLERLYVRDKKTMQEIARHFNVSLDAVVYAMRKHGIPRRTLKEASALCFKQKAPSFARINKQNAKTKMLDAMGAMLYWAEGSKNPAGGMVDFANSDPMMVQLFLRYLRTLYVPDEKRFRIYLYCYSDQNVKKLITFWSSVTAISETQFTKPYVRKDFKLDGRKMLYGMIHVRYGDKKLLLDILSQIEKYKDRFCAGGRVVNYTSL